MRIQSNINALNAYRNLTITNRSLSQSLERLSSGYRINRAADDAAGLAISEKMRGQIRALNRSVYNAQDGINLIQTAERAMIEVHNNLHRMRELAVQAANDTLTANDRMEMQKEVDQLLTEIDRIGNTTEFNTKKLLDGSSAALASSDRLETKIFIRDGLRVEDQFGQKVVDGGNFRLDIVANPGNGQIQKTDIFKVKHGDSVMEVQDNKPGFAISDYFTGLNDIDLGNSIELSFIIDGQEHTINYTPTADEGDDTTGLTAFINDQLGHLVTAYGTGQGSEQDWSNVNILGGGLLVVLDGGAAVDKTEFDLWVSNVTGITTGSLTMSPTKYKAEDRFISSVVVEKPTELLLGDYTVDLFLTDGGDFLDNPVVEAEYRQGDNPLLDIITVDAQQNANISLLLEVTNIEDDDITVTYRYNTMDNAGNLIAKSEGSRVLVANDANLGVQFGGFEFETFNLTESENFTIGDRMLVNAQSHQSAALGFRGQQIAVNRDGKEMMQYLFAANTAAEPITLSFYQLDEINGDYADSEVKIIFTDDAFTGHPLLALRFAGEFVDDAASFTIAESEGVDHIASLNTKLYDIDRFWDASGNFFVEDPQTITLVQGDGIKAAFTIFRDDTIQDVVDKIDAAIRNPKTNYYPGTIEAGKGLGQGVYVDDPNARFAYYVEEVGNPGPYGTYGTVEGTIVINSAIAGKYGEIRFIGDEDIIKALSLTTIRESEENRFIVDVYNAHSDAVVAENIIITSNLLVGAVHTNVDVEFDPSANISVGWQNAITGQQKEEYTHPPNAFYFESQYVTKGEKYQTFIHLADNTLVYHIGANPMQNVGAAIGDMRTRALGVHNIVVIDRASANDAINRLDGAIDRVSSERSRLGALQNRLDHTILNLAVASENLSTAESRIRDVDMAYQMMEFTKQQILMQAGTAMLAQANMKPQMVLQLLG